MSVAVGEGDREAPGNAKLGWALRKRMPNFVRRAWRLGRAATAGPLQVPRIPPELFAGARLYPDRGALIAALPRGGRVLEVGTDRGAFARTILSRAEPARLDVIDLDFSRFDETLRQDTRIRCLHGASVNTMGRLEHGAYDWIYIDAGHSYEDVAADARAARPLLRPGGFLMFNDFAHIDPMLGRYGVHRAVAQFLLETRWMIHAMSYEPHGLYDIALRAPETGQRA